MNDLELHKKCIDEILHKLNWGSPSNWSNRNFEDLSELLFKETNINISRNTLKRLFGVIDTKNDYNPQNDTKKALAIFLGFDSWIDYRQNAIRNNQSTVQIELENKTQPISEKNTQKTILFTMKRMIFLCLSLIGIVLIVLISLWWYKSNQNAQLLIDKPKGESPHTISYKVKTNKASLPLVLHFGDKDTCLIQYVEQIVRHTYYFPNIHSVYLTNKGKKLAESIILIQSSGWDAYLREDLNKNFMMKIQIPDTNYLCIPEDIVKQNGFNPNKIYWTEFRQVKDFKISGDNLFFSSKLKSFAESNNFKCYNIYIKIKCEYGQINPEFIYPEGCNSVINAIFGNVKLQGTKDDMSPFVIDFYKEQLLSIKTKNNEVSLFLNEKLIYKVNYKITLGGVKGVFIGFLGSGLASQISIKRNSDM